MNRTNRKRKRFRSASGTHFERFKLSFEKLEPRKLLAADFLSFDSSELGQLFSNTPREVQNQNSECDGRQLCRLLPASDLVVLETENGTAQTQTGSSNDCSPNQLDSNKATGVKDGRANCEASDHEKNILFDMNVAGDQWTQLFNGVEEPNSLVPDATPSTPSTPATPSSQRTVQDDLTPNQNGEGTKNSIRTPTTKSFTIQEPSLTVVNNDGSSQPPTQSSSSNRPATNPALQPLTITSKANPFLQQKIEIETTGHDYFTSDNSLTAFPKNATVAALESRSSQNHEGILDEYMRMAVLQPNGFESDSPFSIDSNLASPKEFPSEFLSVSKNTALIQNTVQAEQVFAFDSDHSNRQKTARELSSFDSWFATTHLFGKSELDVRPMSALLNSTKNNLAPNQFDQSNSTEEENEVSSVPVVPATTQESFKSARTATFPPATKSSSTTSTTKLNSLLFFVIAANNISQFEKKNDITLVGKHQKSDHCVY